MSRTWVDGNAPYLSAATLNALEKDLGVVLSGAGIDPTGSGDSTAAVQAIFTAAADGTTIRVPDGAIINLTATINVAHRIRLTGAGELRWTAGIASSAMFSVTADGCHFDGVHLTNPNHLAAQTGNRTYGIYFQANSGRVTGCRIVGQQQAVCVSAAGEYHDFTIANNLILDVPGSGDGASSGSSNGEDRGDGIIVWGATATITGNRVDLLSGSDGRIGIHCESLPGSEGTGYVHGDSMCTITGNVVTGKFRRGITYEGVAFSTITGNTVADSTWWGINISNTAHHCIVANNTINWTRTSTDNQGSAWTPSRSGIMVYDQNQNTEIVHNVIVVASGAVAKNGITVQASDSSHLSQNILVAGNRITDPAGGFTNGITISNGSVGTRILDNDIDGWQTYGIYCALADQLTIRGNRVTGASTPSGQGINANGTATWARIDSNTVTNVTTGIACFQRSGFETVIGNTIQTATTGIDLYQSTGKATVNSNTFVSVSGSTTQNLPTGAVTSGNN